MQRHHWHQTTGAALPGCGHHILTARSTAVSATRKPSSLPFGPVDEKWDIMGKTNLDSSGLMEPGFRLFLEDGLNLSSRGERTPSTPLRPRLGSEVHIGPVVKIPGLKDPALLGRQRGNRSMQPRQDSIPFEIGELRTSAVRSSSRTSRGAMRRRFRFRAASTIALRVMRRSQARRWASLPSNPSHAFHVLTNTA